MQRSAQLVPLSQEHHQGLVVAQQTLRLQSTSSAEAIQHQVQVLQACLHSHAQQHFVLEEKFILEPLQQLDLHQDLVARIYNEHQEFRTFAAQQAGVALTQLQTVAKKFKQHIQCEERQLFPLAEQHLTKAQLDQLYAAHSA